MAFDFKDFLEQNNNDSSTKKEETTTHKNEGFDFQSFLENSVENGIAENNTDTSKDSVEFDFKDLSVEDIEKGKIGYNNYLLEIERQKNAEKKEDSELKWWERVFRAMGSSPDATAIGSNLTIATEALREDTSWKEPMEEWSDEQRYTFGYYYDTYGIEAAEEYAASVNNGINLQKEQEQAETVKEESTKNPLKAAANTVGAIASSALGGGDFLYDLAQKAARGRIVSDGEMSPYEWSQAVTGGISEHLNEEYGTLDGDIPVIGGKGWGDVYGIGTSIGQSMATAYTLGGTGTLLTYFGSAAASGIDDAKNRGASDEQAIAFGIMSGFAEAIPEMLSVERLLKIGSSKTFKELMLNIVKQSGAEGIEEGTTSIINTLADNIVMGDFSNFNILAKEYVAKGMSEEEAEKQAWKDIVEGIAFDSLAGAVSGGVSGGIQTGIQSALSAVANEVVHNKPQTQERAQADAGAVVAKNATVDSAEPKTASAKADATPRDSILVYKGKTARDVADIRKIAASFEHATHDTPGQIASMYSPKDNLSPDEFIRGAEEAYRFGTYSYPISHMEAEGTFSKSLPSAKRLQSYYIGKNNAEAAIIDSAKETQSRVLPGVKGRVVYESGVAAQKMSFVQKATIGFVEAVSKATGMEYHIFASYVQKKDFTYTNKNGEVVELKKGERVFVNSDGEVVHAANGWYDPVKHQIWLDVNAGSEGQGIGLYTITHEHVHDIRTWSAEHYNKLAEITAAAFERSGKSFEEAVARKLAQYRKTHPETTLEVAREEVIAETMSALLRDKKGLTEFSNQVYKQDRTLWEKIKDWFKDVIAKITNAYKNLAPESEEARMLMEQKELFEEAQKVFAEAVATAGQNYRAYSEMAGVQIDTNTDSVAPSTMFSERTWSESEYVRARTETARAISKELNVNLDQAYGYIDSINGVAKLIADDRVRLDYEPNLDENATVLKPNSEYGVTVDMSTLCAKRLLTTGTFDAIQKRLPETVFDSEDIVKLRKMMMDRGYEVACGICYVESTRREMGRITQEFIDRYKIAQQTGKPIARVNASGQEVILKSQGKTFMAEKGYTPNLGELNTTDIDYVKRDHPEVYNAYLAFMNARGQAKPKLLETRAEYKGEILKQFKRKDSVEKKNLEGGLRLQSFSDFELPHLIDMMQIVMDMSRVGLKSQAYTKVPKFAEAFGDTGIKINLSLIAKGKGVDANGNLIFDDIEGINHEEAFRIRERFSNNVGTILVGKNDEHIRAAMADPRIDMIIPFHKSSWKESLYEALGLTGYTDYTKYQMEKPIDKSRGKIDQFHSDEYWDYSKSGDENAQIYLRKCREDGRTPVFPQFQNEPGYWKMLIDFKMYDNDGFGAPHEVVKPVFNNEYNAKILDEYKGGHRKLPVAQDVVEDFVKEYDTGIRFQDRDSDGRELSKEQVEYFKDSKARDAKGRLLTLYHGSDRKVTAFDPQFSDDKTSLFFTNNYEVAHSYTSSDRLLNPYAYLDENSSIEDIAKVIEEARPYYSSVKTIDAAEAKAVVEEFKNKSGDIIDAMQGFLDASEGTNLGNSFFAQSIKSNLDSFKGWMKGGVVLSFNPLERAGTYSRDLIQNVDKGAFKNPPEVKNALQRMADVIEPIYDRFTLAQAYDEGGIIEITDKFGKKEYLAKSTALKRANFEQAGGILPVYANITNPLVVDAKGKRWNQIEVPPEMEGHTTKTELLTRDIAVFAHDNGYDGVIFKNLVDMAAVSKVRARKSTVVVAFDGKQIKSVDNKTPTSNPDIRYSLRDVEPVQPSSGKWQRTLTTSEVMERFPDLWNVTAEESDVRNPTQVKVTLGSYRKIYDFLKNEGFDGKILDASSGLGHGTKAGVEEYGFDVEDIEPYPDKNYHPKYKDYSKLHKKYDVIISNAVLNVIPQDQRDALVVKMGELLNEGGRMFINVRGKDVENASKKVTINKGLMEYYISTTGSYQKGFTKPELVAYLQDALGDGYDVKATNMFGAVSAVVTKKTEDVGVKYSLRGDYWKPVLDKDEWQIVNYVVENQLGEEFSPKTDYFFRNTKGKTVFGIYSTDYKTLLYAIHGERAYEEYEFIKFVGEEFKNGAYSSTKRPDTWAEDIWMRYNAGNSNDGSTVASGRHGRNAALHGKQYIFDPGTALQNVLENIYKKEILGGESRIKLQERLSVEDRNRVEILENKVKRLEGELKKMEADAVLAGQMSQGKTMAKEMRHKAEAYEKAIAKKKEQISEVRARRDELLEKARKEKADAVAKVRQEARDRLEKTIADVKAEKNARIDALREKHIGKETAIKEKYRDSIKKATEGRHRTLMRGKIKRVVGELNDLLLHGGKERHVPEHMKGMVARALAAIDLYSPEYYESRIKNLIEEIANENDLAERGRLKVKLAGYQMAQKNAEFKLSEVREEYQKIANSDDPVIKNGYDPVVAQKIEAVAENFKNTSFGDMSISQLEQVYELFKMLKTSISKANELFGDEKKQTITETADKIIEEIERFERKNKSIPVAEDFALTADYNNLKPVYFFERLGSPTLKKLFRRLRDGEDTYATDVREAFEFAEKLKEKYHFSKWDMKKTFEFKSFSGKDFELTVQQMMSIYAYSKRDQAYKHLTDGGFVFDSLATKIKKKLGIPVKYKVDDATPYNIDVDTIKTISENLTDEQRAFADEMQTYLSDVMGAKGNEISMAMYDVKLFKEKDYFPLKTSDLYNAVNTKDAPSGMIKLKNSGFTKERVPGANNPIILSDFMDVWANHVNDMSMYHAFVLPIENFGKILNFKTPIFPNHKSVEGVIQNAFGGAAVRYIEQLIKDINGNAVSDSRENVAKALTSRFNKAAVSASLSVVIQQPSALVRACAVISPKYFAGLPNAPFVKHKSTWEEVKKYAPVAFIKEMGHFDMNTGRGTVEFLKNEKGIMPWIDKASGFLPSYADEFAWNAIWHAVKRETKAKNPQLNSKSEEFLKICGERFTEVIIRTQVYDSTLSRSANMRSSSFAMSVFTAFMAEPTTSINMLEDAVLGKDHEKNYGKKAALSVASSVLLNSILVSFVYAARDDDEDETYWEKYLSKLTTELIDGINPLTYFPILKDMWSIMQGYDVERMDMSLFSKFYEEIEKFTKLIGTDTLEMSEEEKSEHRKNIFNGAVDLCGSVANFIGMPMKNLVRDVRAIANLLGMVDNGLKNTATSIADALGEGVVNSVPNLILNLVGYEKETKQDKLYDAIMSKDETYLERIRSGYKDESSYTSAVRKALKENDPRIEEAARLAAIDEDYAGANAIAKEIIGEGNFDDDVVFKVIADRISAIKGGDDETASSPKNYGMFNAEQFVDSALDGDKTDMEVIRNDFISKKLRDGKTQEEAEKSFTDSVKNELKDRFESGEISAENAAKILAEHCGKSRADAESTVEYWNFKNDYPDTYVDDAWFDEYHEEVESSGLDIRTFMEYRNAVKGITGKDKKKLRMEVIDSLPISKAQKDALYYAEGWAKSTIGEAPWH